MIRECGARARTNNYQPCRRIAMENGRCHLHGGKVPKHNPGPKTPEGRIRQQTSNWKHGLRSKEAQKEASELRAFIKQSKEMIADF